MSTSMRVITTTLQQPQQPEPAPLRVPARTPLQKFALATVSRSRAHELARVPNPLPRRCAYNNFRCLNHIGYKVDEGWLCSKHFDLYWEMGHNVIDHRIVRLASE